ncbi:MAG: YdcF family protein [Ancrocorticia sp.]|uniref:YdcF family protein n=1 Tax=Ancrocorticia sp. TaxID=2593684 RepID=UPI003F92B6B8
MLILSAVLLALGIAGFVRDRRRLRNIVFILFGLGTGLIGVIIHTDDGTGASLPVAIVLIALAAAPVIGYPVLTVFLLVNGVTMIRRERPSFGNLLSLLAGIVLVALPIGAVVVEKILPGHIASAITTGLFGITLYFAFFFLVFLIASYAYRKVPTKLRGGYVIVLGSGLRGTTVPPLLAARLEKGIEAAKPAATIIPSGGQGPGEAISEGEGMARYLRERGIDESRIMIEDQARNTRENLEFSRKLLPSPDTAVIVATNSYHVFRSAMLTRQLGMNAQVVGAKTARYYVPSAFLREFAAVIKYSFGLNVTFLGTWTIMVIALLVAS